MTVDDKGLVSKQTHWKAIAPTAGYDLERFDEEVVVTMPALADEQLTEGDLAAWIRAALTM